MYISSSLHVYSVFNSSLVFNILHKMTGQSCAAVCVVLCVLAATAHSFSFHEVPSAYDDDVPPAYDDDNSRCFIVLSLMATSFGIVALMNLTCIQHQISYIIYCIT